ncbi:MAG: hypothetical protein RLZZ584_4079 [Pseudomonadota bacterium]|jgi:hypothetical protein
MLALAIHIRTPIHSPIGYAAPGALPKPVYMADPAPATKNQTTMSRPSSSIYRITTLLLFASLGLTGCGGGSDDDDGNGALMSPGEDCVACHRPGGSAAEHPFSIGGTVYASAQAPANAGIAGVTVVVTDARGQTVSMTTNAAGNFYSTAALSLPLQAAHVLRNGVRKDMATSSFTGACASCHTPTASGRIFIN